jgi:diguanylate cyclase (GGDEF)-like protein
LYRKTALSKANCMSHLPSESVARQGAILIVDNAGDSGDALRSALQHQGYQALMASCGEQALEIALHAQPDLILLEVALPGMDGLETCGRLKANPATAHIPVIFVSENNGAEEIVAAFDTGAADYVAKPPRMTELCARVRAQLHHKRSAHALERAALVDPLTRIANRRHFDSFLEKEWQRSLRSGAPMSLLMLDVDHFKLYNDTLGHAAGDDCLQQVAAVLQQHASRPADLAARYGGEEFVVLFGETVAEAAATLAASIRAAVEALHIANPRSPTSNWVTVSIGVASAVPGPQDTSCNLLLTADRRLYAAKGAGRNRVETAATFQPRGMLVPS